MARRVLAIISTGCPFSWSSTITGVKASIWSRIRSYLPVPASSIALAMMLATLSGVLMPSPFYLLLPRGLRFRLRHQFDLEIWKTDGSLWPLFEPHHYLKLPRMVGAAYYVGTVDGELAVHLAVSSLNKGKSVEARACRLVTMPEWQGAGVGFRFLNEICAMQERGDENARLAGRKTTTIFHTSHPQLWRTARPARRTVPAPAMAVTSERSKGFDTTARKASRRRANGLGGDG
jgi:GNAT superfamily N-acetyltransferase